MEVKRLVEAWLQGKNDNGNKPVPAKKGCPLLPRAVRTATPSLPLRERPVSNPGSTLWPPKPLERALTYPATHVVHLEAASIIDYAQEAGRAGRAGEETVAEIVVEEKDWPADDTATDRFVEPKRREVNSLIRTQGCRRRVLGQCLDGDPRDCRGINAVLCDNCQRDELKWKSELSSQGLIMSREYTKRAARGMEQAAKRVGGDRGAWREAWLPDMLDV
ncbi:recQ family helicase, partial [Metarhizium majus ARSEF 297]